MRANRRTAFARPEKNAWDAAGTAGEQAARDAIHKLSPLFLPPNDPQLAYAVALGAIVNLGQFLRRMSKPEGMANFEPWALAYLRGALRGESGPVQDNGKPFVRRSDA